MGEIDGFEEFATALEEFAADTENAADQLNEVVGDAVLETGLQVEDTAKTRAPVDTGTLRASIGTSRLGQLTVSVGTTVKYAPDVEFGTKPHPITPDGKDALAFEVGGETIVRSRVEHPGTPAQPFMRPAVRRHEDDLVDNINDAVTELLSDALE